MSTGPKKKGIWIGSVEFAAQEGREGCFVGDDAQIG
jgi:hypothetical protein